MQGRKLQNYNCGNKIRIVNTVITKFTNYLQILKAYMQSMSLEYNKFICKKKSTGLVYMSVPTSTPPVFQPYYPTDFLHDQIYATVAGTAERTKQQAANDIARDILRAVEHNGANNAHVTEISAAQLASAIERNGALNASTTERVNSQLASAVERNGATNQAAIERTAGEARLTTVVSDAASRQAANDSARDVERAIDRNGLANLSTTKDAYNGILSSVERNAGETRLAGAISAGVTDTKLTDVRHSVLNDVNRVENEIVSSNTQNFNVLNKAITDSAWENRTAMSTGFQNIGEEHLRTKFDLSKQNADHYATLLLEQQKMATFLASKADNHFAVNQLEMQKVKEGLACQAAQNFAITQLEAQKNREAIQMQLAEAKYEALKSQQYLGDKMAECCCTIKEKIDTVDRDRLRDHLTVSRDKNNMLEQVEFLELLLSRRGGWGEGRGGHGHHDRR